MKPNNFSPVFYLLLTALPIFVLFSCSTTENSVTTVKSPTVFSQKPDTETVVENEPVVPMGSTFQALTIGENQPIYSLDPLFATTLSEMHAIQLVYEGLVRFDNHGKIVPAIAKSWTISNHHQKFRFTIKNNIYYQNSSLFSSGRGRELRPSDIKKDFERMAQADVPSNAAKLFMNIRGFEPYFQERHHVYRSSKWQFHSISGIKIPNDSTIVFTLVQPDRHFLEKLASPYAVIYPPGADHGNHFEVVGTGPFKFSARRSDSLYIFAKAKNYHGNGQTKLNRINIITSSHGMVLLNLMKQGYINLIPSLAPQQMAVVTQTGGGLKPSLTKRFQLLKPAGRVASFKMKYNLNALQSENAVVSALSPLDITFFSELPPKSAHLQWVFPSVSSSVSANTLSSDYTTDPFIRAFYMMLSSKLAKQGVAFNMKQTWVVNRTIPLHTSRVVEPYGGFQQEVANSGQILASFKVNIWALTGKHINHLSFNHYPWWINLRNVTVNSNYNR